MGLYIGVMSGTSMDAVDCVLVDFSADIPELLASHRSPWPSTLRERLHSVAAGGPVTASHLAQLDTGTGRFIADAVNELLTQTGHSPVAITAIGSHGQTVAHSPGGAEPATLQLGDANVIAERTGVTTVADFRRRDVAAGGQGAPLAPAFHDAMLRSTEEDRIVLNLGGIANVTMLPSDTKAAVQGFDTGPANCLMDLWTRQHLGRPFDEDGQWAASAEPDRDLLERLLEDPYFALAPPKSTGTQYFSRPWLQKRLGPTPSLAPEVVQATLLALTVKSVSDAIHRHPARCDHVLVCGGGARNNALLTGLRKELPSRVDSTAAFGFDPQWVEAMAFAWLARQTLAKLPGNLPKVTGACGPRILGTIHSGG